ncbi:hypothetical protein ACFVH7_42340, partial [Kitasatospora indigofera]
PRRHPARRGVVTSRRRHRERPVRRHFQRRATRVEEQDAVHFGLNAISDGRHVLLPTPATSLAGRLAAEGYEPIALDVSELTKAGGGPKCCTLQL